MARITFDIDDKLHSQFKKFCIDSNKMSMKKMLNLLIKRVVKNSKKHK